MKVSKSSNNLDGSNPAVNNKANRSNLDNESIEYDDGRSYNRAIVREINQEWIDNHMKNREPQFTKPAKSSIFCGTWNVNAKKQEGGLYAWLLSEGVPIADVYAIGFQEIVDLNAMNVALNSANTQQKSQFWLEEITKCLQDTRQRFTCIGSKALVGILLLLFVKESLVHNITDIRMTTTSVGIMGVLGNKGGVAIRFSLYDTSICFVCAHLAAHRENVRGRNSDYKNITDRSIFKSEQHPNNKERYLSSESDNISETIVMPRCGAARHLFNDVNVLDHDIVFWLGDFNYRIEEEYTIEEIFNKIEKRDFESLRMHDQLNIERLKRNVFNGFDEGILDFPPTYKYQPGTDFYETRAEKKLRAPAWCDRILWRSVEGRAVVAQLIYNRAILNPSDHKPVYSHFLCDLRKVVEAQETAAFQELMNTLKKANVNTNVAPTLEISGLFITAEHLQYEQKFETEIVLKNVSDVSAHWHFQKKLEENKYSKRWISFDKTSGLLLPRETERILVTLLIDKKTAQYINAGRDSLDDIIILRIEKSFDHYVIVSAKYERSCFGMSLEELISTPGPVALLPLPSSKCVTTTNPSGSSSSSNSHSDPRLIELTTSAESLSIGTKLAIPKELWRLVDALYSGDALKEKNLFATPGEPLQVAAIRNSLDHGIDFPDGLSPHSFVECLITFLDALTKPIIIPDAQPQTEVDAGNVRICASKMMDRLPTANYNAFIYLIAFFREVIVWQEYNRVSVENLATLLTEVLTHFTLGSPAPDESGKDEKPKKVGKIEAIVLILSFLLKRNET